MQDRKKLSLYLCPIPLLPYHCSVHPEARKVLEGQLQVPFPRFLHHCKPGVLAVHCIDDLLMRVFLIFYSGVSYIWKLHKILFYWSLCKWVPKTRHTGHVIFESSSRKVLLSSKFYSATVGLIIQGQNFAEWSYSCINNTDTQVLGFLVQRCRQMHLLDTFDEEGTGLEGHGRIWWGR